MSKIEIIIGGNVYKFEFDWQISLTATEQIIKQCIEQNNKLSEVKAINRINE